MNRVCRGLAQAALAIAVPIGAAAAVRDQVEFLSRVPAKAHADAWSRPEAERLREQLQGWAATFEGVRRGVPERAVVWGWMTADVPPVKRLELFDLLRVALAPTLVLPLQSPEFFAARHGRLLDAGFPAFMMECHPAFAPPGAVTPVPDWALDPALGAWVVVAEQPDFTLRELRPVR
jgi:hypothetical protein